MTRCSVWKRENEATGTSPSLRQRAWRMPFAARAEVARQLKVMQETGVIQASFNPWSSPVVLVLNDSALRLNAVTRLDSYHLPRIDDLHTTLPLSTWCQVIGKSECTRIKCQDCLHHVAGAVRISCDAFRPPSTFQRLMQQLLAGLRVPHLYQCTIHGLWKSI